MTIIRLGYKILLTIPSVLEWVYLIACIFPEDFARIAPADMYNTQVAVITSLRLIQIIILLLILWRFKNLEKSKKWEWTWIMILFTMIGAPLFIWKKIGEFSKKIEIHN